MAFSNLVGSDERDTLQDQFEIDGHILSSTQEAAVHTDGLSGQPARIVASKDNGHLCYVIWCAESTHRVVLQELLLVYHVFDCLSEDGCLGVCFASACVSSPEKVPLKS